LNKNWDDSDGDVLSGDLLMTCQRCSESASVHLTEKVNGEAHELHLCVKCARKAGIVLPEKPPALGLDAVVHGLIMSHVSEIVGELADLACPDCGIRFMEFRAEGRLGCPADYEVFEKGLLSMLSNDHGATRHVGKKPQRESQGADRGRLRLRAALRDAIAIEDYEHAARLRDQLRQKDADR
jgi:protein arginine kinase activator